MGMSVMHRAGQCPHVGCSAWALLANGDDLTRDEPYLWTCGAGHHGPRLVRSEPRDPGS